MGANNPFKGGAGIGKRAPRGRVTSFELEGFEDVIAKLGDLPKTLEKKIVRKALRVGGKIILKEARRLAPKGPTGKLKKTIKLKSVKRSRKRIGVYIRTGTRSELGIKKKDKGYYPFSVEFGTQFSLASPYMRPALKNNADRARKEIGKEIKKGLEIEARKP